MRHLACTVLVVLALACGSDPKKKADAAATAMAAAAMTGEKFVANSVPRAFVEKSLESASKNLQEQHDALDAIASMRHAVETNDRPRILDAARRLKKLAEETRPQ